MKKKESKKSRYYAIHARLTEDEMKEDAKILASFVKSSQPAPPLGDPEPPIEQDDKNAGLREMLKTLTNK